VDRRALAGGALYVPAGKYLLFNDIPNDRTLRWDETSGAVSRFQQPCGHRNTART
jgi:gluconolactonase